MSLVNQLSNELTSLITESKRRNSEIKQASERSLTVLKTYNPSMKESVFLESLSHNDEFIAPFLLSCASRNAKFSTFAIQALHKLIQYRSIPVSQLDALVDALMEATHLAVDIQLRVLQILPTFFQCYAQHIKGDLVAKALMICSILQSYNKTPMVVSTAAATEQQVLLALFDKVCEEDKTGPELTESVEVDEGVIIQISANAFDCFRVFRDICSLIEHQKPTFLQFGSISESLGFELLETVLTNYKKLFWTHAELSFLLRTRVTPLLLRSFSNHKDFNIVVRVTRIILLLVKSQLRVMEIEIEVILSLLTHALTNDSNLPQWKKTLSLEVFHGIFQDFDLVKLLFQTYDYEQEKKNSVGDFLQVCAKLLKSISFQKLLSPGEIVKPPEPNERVISQQNSSLSVPCLELLDKTDAPLVPETYPTLLILNCIVSFGEGLGKYVLKLSKADESNTFSFLSDLTPEQQNNVGFLVLKAIISSTVESVVTIGNEFLYSCLSNDLFHNLVRSLQKLCHSSGILGMVRERDSLLLLFSISTVSNTTRKVPQSRNNSLGEFIVEQFTTLPHDQHSESRFHTRSLNPRHIICFRALISLSVSLGPILGKSWRFILITMQWFEYFLNGPSEYLYLKEIPPKPDLSRSDLRSIDTSLSKLNESTRSFDDIAFKEIMEQTIGLARVTLAESVDANDPLFNNELNICPYNREFFMHKVCEIAVINAERLISNHDEYHFWEMVTEFLINFIVSTKTIYEADKVKSNACQQFTFFIKECARIGFSKRNDQTDVSDLEHKLFKSLVVLADGLKQTGKESSVIQIDVSHTLLSTLFDLLDRFGTFFVSSWKDILAIIRIPFDLMDTHTNSTPKSDRSKNLLKSSFEILQLVLNDFLQSVKPLKATKLIIDVLGDFVVQKMDLNISFSAVSYYWQLSEFYKQRSLQSVNNVDLETDTMEELEQIIDATEEGDLNGLWVYLLNCLVKVSNDERIEVRNAAIQTFFRIVDSHGRYINWRKTFNIIVRELLAINLEESHSDDYELRKTFNDSVLVILKGVNDLYISFFLSYNDEFLWIPLITFYQRLISLGSTEITKSVYSSFNQILKSFSEGTPHNLHVIFFGFWSSQKVKYVALNEADAYQSSLVELIRGFEGLYKSSDLSRSQIDLSFTIFNNAMRFPFLPDHSSDITDPTTLQAVVLESINHIKIDETIEDIILLHLSNLILLPFQTRSRILKKLQSANRRKIPSFIAASLKAIDILENFLGSITEYRLLIDNSVLHKVLRNLLDSIKSSSTLISDDVDHQKDIDSSRIWQKSMSLAVSMVPKFIKMLSADQHSREVWRLIIELITLTLPNSNENRDAGFNLEVYQSLKISVLSNLSHESLENSCIELFVSSLWKSSFLYENNSLENYLFANYSSPFELTELLLSLELDGYSTEPVHPFAQQSFRLVCLCDLFEFSNAHSEIFKLPTPSSSSKLVDIALPYLLCRLVLIIRRYCDQQRLVNNLPVPSVQKKELLTLLNNLLQLLEQLDPKNLEAYGQLFSVFPFILDNQQLMGQLKDSHEILTKITVKFYKLTS